MSDSPHFPVRSCVGCGLRDRQTSMVRLVRDGSGALRIDGRRVLPGRGAYLHRAEECLQRFAQRRGPVRSLRIAVDAAARAGVVAELRERL